MTTTAPTVSVIIPNYNHTRFIGDAIRSTLHQTFHPSEIIVVDDGSTDNSREVVAQFGAHVRYLWQENRGLAGARNTGIHAAQGELIGLLDADDVWRPSYLEKMVALAVQHPEAAVYYCSAQGMDVHGQALPQVFGGPAIPPDTMYQALLRSNFLIPSTILLRRAAVSRVGLFDQNLRSCEDWDLWLRILPEQTFIGTSECLVDYRQHGASLSRNLTGMHQAAQAVINKNFGADDGKWQQWSPNKRRAYGGLYRYQLLSAVQRQNQWQAGVQYLRRALQVDPTLATDLDLFYELALGAQPAGQRGTAYELHIADNAVQICDMLKTMFQTPSELNPLQAQVYGTTFCALGLVAYNTGCLRLSQQFFGKALRFRPELWRDKRVITNLAKSYAGQRGLQWLRRLRRKLI